jgi:hypothetical protein
MISHHHARSLPGVLLALLGAGCLGKISPPSISVGERAEAAAMENEDAGPSSAIEEDAAPPPATRDGGATTPQPEASATPRDAAPDAPIDRAADLVELVDLATDLAIDADTPATSGLPAAATLDQLTVAEKRTFCAWGTRMAGGLEGSVGCDGGRTVKLPWPTIETCVRAIPPDCRATVAETELCAHAVVASPCTEEVPRECKTLAACVLARFFDGGVRDAVSDTAGGDEPIELWGSFPPQLAARAQRDCPNPAFCIAAQSGM